MLRLQILTYASGAIAVLLLLAAMVTAFCQSAVYTLAFVSVAALAAWGFVAGIDRIHAWQRAVLQELGEGFEGEGVDWAHGSQFSSGQSLKSTQQSGERS